MKPQVIRDNDDNKVKRRVIQDNDNNNNKMKIITRKVHPQHPKRTREQEIMECQVSLLAHNSDCGIHKKDDDDSNDNEYNNET